MRSIQRNAWRIVGHALARARILGGVPAAQDEQSEFVLRPRRSRRTLLDLIDAEAALVHAVVTVGGAVSAAVGSESRMRRAS
eukprot:4777207-Prymnesium_polylepis.1